MRTYVLMLAKTFPAYHPRAGQPTEFDLQVADRHKVHTVRQNYELWKKRFTLIDAGKACLSVRHWTGAPYKSKQEELYRFDRSHRIGLERLDIGVPGKGWTIEGRDFPIPHPHFAANDGLSIVDFDEWFFGGKKQPESPLAIIHFSEMRYAD